MNRKICYVLGIAACAAGAVFSAMANPTMLSFACFVVSILGGLTCAVLLLDEVSAGAIEKAMEGANHDLAEETLLDAELEARVTALEGDK